LILICLFNFKEISKVPVRQPHKFVIEINKPKEGQENNVGVHPGCVIIQKLFY
jgi:hypothetical protein